MVFLPYRFHHNSPEVKVDLDVQNSQWDQLRLINCQQLQITRPHHQIKQDTARVSMTGRSRSVQTPVTAKFGSVWVIGEQECCNMKTIMKRYEQVNILLGVIVGVAYYPTNPCKGPSVRGALKWWLSNINIYQSSNNYSSKHIPCN